MTLAEIETKIRRLYQENPDKLQRDMEAASVDLDQIAAAVDEADAQGDMLVAELLLQVVRMCKDVDREFARYAIH